MKKLRKLSLKQMESKLPVMVRNELKEILGGTDGFNDCTFEAMSYTCTWLGASGYEYQDWLNLYKNKFGELALIDALMNGITQGQMFDLLDDYFAVGSMITDYNNLGSQEAIGFINGGTHAVSINSYDSQTGMVTYYNPDLNAYVTCYPSEISGYAVSNY